MASFLRSLRKKSSTKSIRAYKAAPSLQGQVDMPQPISQQEKEQTLTQKLSVKQLANEVNGNLRDFQSDAKYIKDASVKLEELRKLLKSGEVTESAYRLIMEELGEMLSLSVEDIFKLREVLELSRAKARLEWAKEKIELDGLPLEFQESVRRSVSYLQEWEDLMSKIDSVLSSLSIEEETDIIEQYLSLRKARIPIQEETSKMEEALSLCQQRLGLISDKWASKRRNYVERIISLELEASQVKDEIKELEVRFAVGEIEQIAFEHKMSALQTTLRKVENEVSEIRKSVDLMDMKIFRCSELSREDQ